MNRAAAIERFHDYTGRYNPDDPMIRHKIVHTLSVAGLSEKIAGSLGLDAEDVDFAWFLGLLHDIGRFEQVRRYGTFVDSQSVDHAEFGADLLFRDGLFRSFPTEDLSPERRQTAEPPSACTTSSLFRRIWTVRHDAFPRSCGMRTRWTFFGLLPKSPLRSASERAAAC